ncbi:MAG TPA: hypothetical protein VMT17_18990 [Anaeromyxobacteraceae bacterium]|nr:hypothetical protein [Anaeromyxobacteraceae bacterium]
MDTALRRSPWLVFGVAAAAIVLASRAVIRSPAFHVHPAAFGAAVTADLTATAAAAYWVTVGRSRRFSPTAVLAIVVAGLVAARLLLPPEERALAAPAARAIAVILELGVVVAVGWVARRVAGAAPLRGDELAIEDVLWEASCRVAGRHWALEAAVGEATRIGMALPWRSAPHVPRGAAPFTVHRKAGLGALLFAIGLSAAAEVLATHALLGHWSVRAAWVPTALSVYGLVWLVGDFRAIRLRPMLLWPNELSVRVGLQWRGRIPLAEMTRVDLTADPRDRSRCAVLSPLGGPNIFVHLAHPVAIDGALGRTRQGSVIGLRVDEPEALRAAILARRPELGSPH